MSIKIPLADIEVGKKKIAKRTKGVFTQEFALPKSSFDIVLLPDGNKRKRVQTTPPPLIRV